jgi:hypothetical protein
MTNGVLINSGGTIVSVVHGWSGKTSIPSGQTFRALDSVAGLERGMAAPAESVQQLAATDHEMARGVEDLVAALLTKGTVAKADLPAALLTKINQRRSLRGESVL